MTAEFSLGRARAFANAEVGKPFLKGGQGPDAYSCWGITRACQRVVFERELPLVLVDETNTRAVIEAIAASPLHEQAEIVARPAHGDLVTMSRHDHPRHIGVYLALDRGGILHCYEKAGVRFDTIATLAALGWYRLKFHRFAGEAA
jgi:hypothetical protein